MNPSDEAGQRELPSESAITTAVAGDRVALERLLLAHYDELARRIEANRRARAAPHHRLRLG